MKIERRTVLIGGIDVYWVNDNNLSKSLIVERQARYAFLKLLSL